MFRYLFALFSLLSLIVCLATSVAWGIGCREGISLSIERFHAYAVSCRNGIFAWETDSDLRRPARDLDDERPYSHHWQMQIGWMTDAQSLKWREGFRHSGGRFILASGGSVTDVTYQLIPCRPVVVLSAIAPLLYAAIRFRPRRRARPGHCRICGYDLRATPDRCPECGDVPKTPPYEALV